jgi:hypothetical protein
MYPSSSISGTTSFYKATTQSTFVTCRFVSQVRRIVLGVIRSMLYTTITELSGSSSGSSSGSGSGSGSGSDWRVAVISSYSSVQSTQARTLSTLPSATIRIGCATFGAHMLQKTSPQARQWCLRQVRENCFWHCDCEHDSASVSGTHSSTVSASSTMVSLQNSAPADRSTCKFPHFEPL